MNKIEFRDLKADEIDVRIAMVKQSGVSLLLYKDARVDQIILDETVGNLGWQRHHSRDNKNCIIAIWDEEKKQWIEKEDTGTESFSEAEKGVASDSFKRSGFNWGIGRELYTAPFIWISSDKCKIEPYQNKFICKDQFKVEKIEIKDKVITGLTIINQKGERVFGYVKK